MIYIISRTNFVAFIWSVFPFFWVILFHRGIIFTDFSPSFPQNWVPLTLKTSKSINEFAVLVWNRCLKRTKRSFKSVAIQQKHRKKHKQLKKNLKKKTKNYVFLNKNSFKENIPWKILRNTTTLMKKWKQSRQSFSSHQLSRKKFDFCWKKLSHPENTMNNTTK